MDIHTDALHKFLLTSPSSSSISNIQRPPHTYCLFIYPMEKLPIELIEYIVGFTELTKEELLANRLVCRGLCTSFTRRAFHTVRTNNFTRESFDRLCLIAQSPHLAQHVVQYEYKLTKLCGMRKSMDPGCLNYIERVLSIN